MNLEMFKELFSNVWSIVLVILFFGGSIFVHELGHFLAARRRGLIVERFSIGFGPKLFSWKKGGVEYRISLLPLGGYVALPQLSGMEAIEGKSKEKNMRPISYADKMIVSVMGAVFNFIFAFILAVILWMVGQPSLMQQETTVVGYVAPTLSMGDDKTIPGPAYEAGLKAGDKILAVDGKTVNKYSDILQAIATGSGRTPDGLPFIELNVLRDGKELTIPVTAQLRPNGKYSNDRFRVIGIMPAQPLKIGAVAPNSPVQKAGIQVNDTILSVDNTPLYARVALNQFLEKNAGKKLILKVEREGKVLSVPVLPELVPYTKPIVQLESNDPFVVIKLIPSAKGNSKENLADAKSPSKLMVYEVQDPLKNFPKLKFKDTLQTVNGQMMDSVQSFLDLTKVDKGKELALSFSKGPMPYEVNFPKDFQVTLIPPRTQSMIGVQAWASEEIILHTNPFEQFKEVVEMTLRTLGSLLSPRSDIGVQHLMGPPGIIRTLHTFSLMDIRLLLWLVIVININLGIFNLLPIPVLDGGHMLFATIDRLRGKPLPIQFVAAVQVIFMVLLLSLMIYTSFFDIRRWRGDSLMQDESAKKRLLMVPIEFKK